MKRWGVKFLLLAIASILVVVAVKYWPRVLTPDQCSEVYRRYKDRDNLSVAFVKDYRIGDSITVDVTTITAKDSAKWEMLLREINTDEETIQKYRNARLNRNKTIIETYYSDKKDISISVSVKEAKAFNLIFVSHSDQILYIFHTKTLEQARKIQSYKINESLIKN